MRRVALWRAAVAVLALAATVTAASAAPSAGVPPLRRVVVIVLENHSYGEIVGASEAPAINRLVSQGALLTRYFAVTHPSLPNYLALVSGDTQGIVDDCTDCVVDARSLADTLEARGKSWKAYAEGFPSPGFQGPQAGEYTKHHVPFLYFRDVVSSPRRLGRIVGLDAWRADLARGALPDLSFVVPDECHDMHDCSRATGDRWLGAFLPRLLASTALRGGAVFVVFDEGNFDDAAGGGGHVAALVLGPAVRPGARYTRVTGHYGVLRTIEDGLGVTPLGRSANAAPITGIWRAPASR
jgi:acid phosphatase